MRHLLMSLFVSLWFASVANAQSFSHDTHYNKHNSSGTIKDCVTCHSYKSSAANFGRPDHTTCQVCHTKENFKASSTSSYFCSTCHTNGGKALHNYPNLTGDQFITLEKFSHKGHLESSASFGKVNCEGCHDINRSDGKAGMSSHKGCAQCHGDPAGNSAVKPLLTSRATQSDCLGCHPDASKEKTTRPARRDSWQAEAAGGSPYSDDLIFAHNKHMSHTNVKQSCKECHPGVESSTDNKRLHLPTMKSCESCHLDASKVTENKVMGKCDACHKVIQKGVKPLPPKHYGPKDEQHSIAVMKSSYLYCGYCHDKPPAETKAAKVEKNCVKNTACIDCHRGEGVPEEKLCWDVTIDRQVGQIQVNNGVFTKFASAFEFKQVNNVAAPLNDIDTQDADVFALLGFDSAGYGKSGNLSASFFGTFRIDSGNTPAFSPFANQFGLDEQPPDDRGLFAFDDTEGAFDRAEVDRTQNNAFLFYRAFAELKQQPVGENALADVRVGRQSIFDAAEPWLFLDGIDAGITVNQKIRVELFGGNRVSLYTREEAFADEIRPLVGGNFSVNIPMPQPTGPLEVKVQDVFHLSNSTRLVASWDTFPNLNSYANFKMINFVPDQTQAGFTFYNPVSGSQLLFNFRHKFDNPEFDFDYTSVSTRGGADLLLTDPNLEAALAQNATTDAAFAELSAGRAADAQRRAGKQLSDFENFNLLPEAPNNRISLLFSQKLARKFFFNLSLDARQVNTDKRNNATLVDDGQGTDLGLGQLDPAETAIVSDLIAEDNRYAYTYPFVEFGPGLDLYDVGSKGLHLGASARYRIADPRNKLGVRLLFADDAAANQLTFFGDISGEKDTTGLTLTLEASQLLFNGKLRLGAAMGLHRYNYLGRYAVVGEDGQPLNAFNGIGEAQAPGIVNLNGISGTGWLRVNITDLVFARALYSAETDLQFFPDDPFVDSGQGNFAAGKEEFASSDITLLQRFMLAAGFRF